MASVYGGAYLSLAASDALNVYEGFLPKRQSYCGGFSARFSTDQVCGIRRFYDPEDYRRSVRDCHLSSRAWTFQEKLLPARTLHFGETGLWWECRTQLSSEYLPDGLTGLSRSPLVRSVEKPWPWTEVVRDYSQANLTYGSDRLVALSGIAARQHGATGDQYLAGLWRASLLHDLLWFVSAETMGYRPEWRAPTWSWASIDGKVSFRGSHHSEMAPTATLANEQAGITFAASYKEYVQVLQAETKPSGPDVFGPVDSGVIILSCAHIIRGTLSRGGCPEDLSSTVPFDTGLGVFPVDMDCWEADSWSGERVAYLVPVMTAPSENYSGKPLVRQGKVCGLVLEKCSDSTDDFRRIGSFYFVTPLQDGRTPLQYGPSTWEPCFRRFLNVLDELCDMLATGQRKHDQWMPEHKAGRYIVSIV